MTSKARQKYKTLSVDRDTVCDLWDLPYEGNPDEGVEVISDEIIDKTRWSIVHELTVRIKGTIYQTSYMRGATEYQEEAPWDCEKEVTFVEMKEVEKLVKLLEPVLLEV
jgi:hypothetical protein